MKFLEYLIERGGSIPLGNHNSRQINFNDYSKHSFNSRLKRSGLTKEKFIEKVKYFLDYIDKNNKPMGKYGVIFKDFSIIGNLKKHEFYMFTILGKEMDRIENVDFIEILKEWIEKVYDVKIDLNSAAYIDVNENEYLMVENSEKYGLEIYGNNFYIIEMDI